MNTTTMTNHLEPDEPRERALKAAVSDLAAATTTEEMTAAVEAVRQIPIDMDRMINAVHVPEGAGEYEQQLRSLLERIPDGWGRWIDCGPGWYPILANLEQCLNALEPDYEVHQIKEKYGTLRFYWSGNHPDGDNLIDEAETRSAQTCELCGTPGRLRSNRGWYQTLCDACAESRGYEDLDRQDPSGT